MSPHAWLRLALAGRPRQSLVSSAHQRPSDNDRPPDWPHAMFKERFESGQHQGKPLCRIGHVLHDLISVTGEAGLGDPDERHTDVQRRERPFNRRGPTVSRPLDDNSSVAFDHRGGDLESQSEQEPRASRPWGAGVAAATVGPAVEGWFESGIRNYSTLVSIGVLVVLSSRHRRGEPMRSTFSPSQYGDRQRRSSGITLGIRRTRAVDSPER